MAFTKVSLTGTIDTIKEAYTAFNNFIDDLLSTSSGKGASQVGIEDSAGNMAATNVEDGLAEIYADTESARALAEVLNENPDTTTGLTWGHKAGQIRYGNTVTSVSAGTVALADNTDNYVEINTSGTVSTNTTGFTVGRLPIRFVTTLAGVQTVSTDMRSWFSINDIKATILNEVEGSNFKNIGITASVGSKALTVALKGEDGNNPSSTNTVYIKFRSATATTGIPVIRSVTGALSVTLSSGSTLGFTAAGSGRLYVWAIDNAGTVELALSRTADIFDDSRRVTTTAEGGAGGADSATTMYSTAARTNVACRCIGYIEITTGATAGEWDNAPTKIQVMWPGVKRTGDIVQRVYNSTGALVACATTIPYDNTIPQITEGNEVLTQAIVPTSAINKLIIEIESNMTCNSAAANTMCLFQDTTAGALACQQAWGIAVSAHYTRLTYIKIAGTAASTTFRMRCGTNSGVCYVNSDAAGNALYGGALITSISVTEVFV